MGYGRTIRVRLGYDEAVEAVKEAFAEQGFGTLTTIDVRATMEAKLGADMEPYVILGMCNPPLAHRALGVDREVGLLLPCNVVVRQEEDGCLVHALDPDIMVSLTGLPDLRPVAEEVGTRIDAALRRVADRAPAT